MKNHLTFPTALKILSALAATAALAACQVPPVTKQEAGAVNYGPRPAHWQEEIRSYLNLRLTDPKTALVEFRTEPRQFFQRSVGPEPQQYGWAVCVWVNDKNRQGAYDGFYPMTFFIRNEKIVAVNSGPDNFGPVGATYARRQCKELGAPFGQ
jgi:hypothetical protein